LNNYCHVQQVQVNLALQVLPAPDNTVRRRKASVHHHVDKLDSSTMRLFKSAQLKRYSSALQAFCAKLLLMRCTRARRCRSAALWKCNPGPALPSKKLAQLHSKLVLR
jgi:hypothetical protein